MSRGVLSVECFGRLCDALERSDVAERPTLHLAILGHVDAGKSTLMGRLLYDMGYVDRHTQHKNEKEASESGKVRRRCASELMIWVL